MPCDRFIHPRLGQSEKVNLLTELEFRVWIHYLLAADDYGVMRFSAVNIQSSCDALHSRPTKTIQRCLDRLIDVQLVVDWLHQGRKYISQLDWQKYQRVKFPRETNNPIPPSAILARCDDATRFLFVDHHPMATVVASSLEAEAASTKTLDVHQMAPQIMATANGNGNGTGLRERFADFWKHYPRRVGKDAAWKAWQKVKPSAELLAQMIGVLAWQKQQDDWIRDGGRFVPHPATWINQGRWEDEPQQTPRVSNTTLARGRATEEFLKS